MTKMFEDAKKARRKKDEETLKTADHYRQRWTADEDEIVLARESNDLALAVQLGRTFSSVVQRRSALRRMMAGGLSLQEIHDVEEQLREAHNRVVYMRNMDIQTTCPECFCSPHASWCSYV